MPRCLSHDYGRRCDLQAAPGSAYCSLHASLDADEPEPAVSAASFKTCEFHDAVQPAP